MRVPIDSLRQFSETLMPDTVEIRRKSRVSDGEGGYTSTWATVETTTGRYQTAGARELEIASHLANAVEGTITLPFGTDVQETDQLIRAGITYNVSGILSSSDALSAHVRVLVRRA